MRLTELRKTPGAAARVIPLFLEWLIADKEYGMVDLPSTDDFSRALLEETVKLFRQKCADVGLWQELKGRGRKRMLDPHVNGLKNHVLAAATYAAEVMVDCLQGKAASATTIRLAETCRTCVGLAIVAADPEVSILAVRQVHAEKIEEFLQQGE